MQGEKEGVDDGQAVSLQHNKNRGTGGDRSRSSFSLPFDKNNWKPELFPALLLFGHSLMEGFE